MLSPQERSVPTAEISLAALERIEVCCTNFESALQRCPTSTLEPFLARESWTSAVERERLLYELLWLEWDYRRPAWDTALDGYLSRFPEDERVVRAAFENFQRGHSTKPGDVPQDATLQALQGEAEAARIQWLAEPLPAIQLKDYELLERVGYGGMGVVYKARQVSLDRIVALKMIRMAELASAEERRRFRAEAAAVARLDHSGIVCLHEFGSQDGLSYFTMAYVEGESLEARLAAGPLPPAQAADIVRQVARAIAYAHGSGVVHRDLKPANVLLDNHGQAKVADFGLAKHLEAESQLTATGQVLGTPSFMAPEQAAGKHNEVGPLADVYSLGAILYCALVGWPPFRAASAVETLRQVLDQEPIAPRRLDAQIPRDLETICLKCLEKSPRRRFASAEEVAEELGRFLNEQPILARPLGRCERAWRWGRRNRTLAALSAAFLALVITVSGASVVVAFILARALETAERAQTQSEERLWESYVSQARAMRKSAQPGQRYESLRSLDRAQRLVTPPGHSEQELRTEAIAALLLPDMEPAKEWDGWPTGSLGFAVDDAFDRYARGDRQGAVSVRRLADDQELLRLPGASQLDPNVGLQFSHDGRFLCQLWAVGTGCRTRLWDLATTPPRCVREADDRCLDFSPDSRRLAIGEIDGDIHLVNTSDGRELRQMTSGLDHPRHLRWRPRTSEIAIATRTEWRIVDVESGTIRLQHTVADPISWLAWRPNSRWLAVVGNQEILLWDVETDKLVRRLPGHKDSGGVARFNWSGNRLVTNDWLGMLRMWDVVTGEQLLTQQFEPGGVPQFSPDDTLLAGAAPGETLRLFRVSSGSELRTVVQPEPGNHPAGYLDRYVDRAALSADGRCLALSSHAGIALVDLHAAEQVALLPLPWNFPLYFSKQDGALWTYGAQGLLRWPWWPSTSTPREWSLGPPEKLAAIEVMEYIGASRDGDLLALPESAHVRLWRRSSNQSRSLEGQDNVRSCAISPDGQYVATGSHGLRQGGGARVWSTATGKVLAELPVDKLCRVDFSPDGQWLATNGGGIRLWQVGTWKEGPPIGGPPQYGGYAFSTDGTMFAVMDAPGVIRLIELPSGTELARLTAPKKTRLHPLGFTPDNGQLAAVGRETQALYIFDLQAVRRGLRAMKLDWSNSPLPKAAHSARAPLKVHVLNGAE